MLFRSQRHSAGLVCLSFSVVGELCTFLLEDRDIEARQASEWYESVFGERYYLELQNHSLPAEGIAMNKLLNLGYKTKAQVVLTNDCHYLRRKDSPIIDVLNCIRKGIDLRHHGAKRFACNEYYLKTAEEMWELFDFPPQLISNTLEIAKLIELDLLRDLPTDQNDWDAIKLVIEPLRTFSSELSISFDDGKHLKVSILKEMAGEMIGYLKDSLPGYNILPFTEYSSWTPKQIYAAALKTFGVQKYDIAGLCAEIPSEAETLIDAILMSTDFSCLSSEDFVYGEASSIGNKLTNTFRSELTVPGNYAFIPRDLAMPLVRDQQGNVVCQFDKEALNMMGCVTMEVSLV